MQQCDLRGNDVNLILTVLANGSPAQDSAQWLAPREEKKSLSFVVE